ncbi:GntP family permease [Confluentibacter flavum]|uniref:Gluconate transporter n=1 Tax=Confluentibacter flavum TaxID=1909700 RepID=A0A2N3HJ17_9FLAO|nr:GntP family permease [Confluentibacter flavum]PKQ44884.1 gluconate transporter [Confluentibacter flavum]
MEILIVLLVVVALMVIAASKYKFHPFLSLLMAGIIMGFVGELSEEEITTALTNGFGKTLGSIGIIIAFGTIIGAYLEKSGGAKTLANWALSAIGAKRSILAMNITGFIVSIPVYCDSGFIILSSLNKAISKSSKIPVVVLAVSLAAGLYSTHVFVPPTPGPLAATAALNADLGLVILLGLVIAIPVSLIGFFWAKYIERHYKNISNNHDSVTDSKNQTIPKTSTAFMPIVIPIVLIALKSISNYPTHPLGEGLLFDFTNFIGNPVIALLIGVFLAFKLKTNVKEATHYDWVTNGLKEAGIIILITGAGGAFGSILQATGIGNIIGNKFSDSNLGLFLPFIIAALLKTAQGSSTVSIITTAAIMAPILASFGLDSSMGRALTVLAIGAGAMTVSHLNDSYFWVVAQFSGMNTTTALKTQTVSTFLQGIVGIILIMILGWIFI